MLARIYVPFCNVDGVIESQIKAVKPHKKTSELETWEALASHVEAKSEWARLGQRSDACRADLIVA